MVFAGSSPITTTSPSSKAHQKSGPFPQPALPGFDGHTTPSDSRHGRRLRDVEAATLACDGSPPITRTTFPTCRAHYPGVSSGCACRLLPRSYSLPQMAGGSASALSLSRCYGADRGETLPSSLKATSMEHPMSQLNDLSRSLTSLEQDNEIVAVIEMSQSSWLVAGIVPGIERHPLKKLEPNEGELLRLLMRWRAEATKMGCSITRIAVAYEAGRDGFWLARWLRAHDIETYVIHPTSVAVSREHRRAKTDRLDTRLLKRVFIGWPRGGADHCQL